MTKKKCSYIRKYFDQTIFIQYALTMRNIQLPEASSSIYIHCFVGNIFKDSYFVEMLTSNRMNLVSKLYSMHKISKRETG